MAVYRHWDISFVGWGISCICLFVFICFNLFFLRFDACHLLWFPLLGVSVCLRKTGHSLCWVCLLFSFLFIFIYLFAFLLSLFVLFLLLYPLFSPPLRRICRLWVHSTKYSNIPTEEALACSPCMHACMQSCIHTAIQACMKPYLHACSPACIHEAACM